MSPQKLSDSDKQEIIQLYRTSPETTASLAQRYGVSSSTVSRFLKSYFSETEYENLIQYKRSIARSGANQERHQPPSSSGEVSDVQDSETQESSPSSGEVYDVQDSETQESSPSSGEVYDVQDSETQESSPSSGEVSDLQEEDTEVSSEAEELVDFLTLNEMLGEDLEDLEDDDEDDYGEDEDWEEETIELDSPVFQQALPQIEVLPLSDAYFPKVCYVVIDRFAELITRPLQEFGDLGPIPLTEVKQTTLPIFDNQKVARRFSNRSQRVIKIPDGRLLKKTSSYLKAKGITRLLIDGQVYAC